MGPALQPVWMEGSNTMICSSIYNNQMGCATYRLSEDKESCRNKASSHAGVKNNQRNYEAKSALKRQDSTKLREVESRKLETNIKKKRTKSMEVHCNFDHG